MRIAFLTPEFTTPGHTVGGLANFVGRLARALVDRGHQIEVFTLEPGAGGERDGYLVHEVPLEAPAFIDKLLNLPRRVLPSWRAPVLCNRFRSQKLICELLTRRDQEDPFDIIHTADYGTLGYWLPDLLNERIVLRCSSVTELMRKIEHGRAGSVRSRTEREHKAIRSAACSYAPSRFTADYFRQTLGVDMRVIRPPFFLETEPAETLPFDRPERYLLHCGNINRVKGSDWLAESLSLAWEKCPDLRMIWAGVEGRPGLISSFRKAWGQRAHQVQWLGKQPKAIVYHLMKHAAAVVAPSRCDNLPNVVLEAQALGTPVIGSRGASIDEIVEDGRTGKLVEMENVKELAKALVEAWRGETPFDQPKCLLPQIFNELVPELAICRLLTSVGSRLKLSDSTCIGEQ